MYGQKMCFGSNSALRCKALNQVWSIVRINWKSPVAKYFAGVSQAIVDNKMSSSLSNERKKHLKPNTIPLMLLSYTNYSRIYP